MSFYSVSMSSTWIWLKHYWRLSCYGLRTAGLGASIAAFRSDVANAAAQSDDFDALHGTETSASVFPWDAGLSRQEQAQSIVYMASDRTSFQQMLMATGLRQGDFRRFAFIDIGSGKGRVVLMAGEYPFASVTGVELSPPLVATAWGNAQCCRGLARQCGTMQFVQKNATHFCFPAQPLVLYFYHPFITSTMELVMDNLVTSLKVFPRPVFILYREPLFGRKYPDMCIAAGANFRKVAERPSCREKFLNPWSVWQYCQSGL